MIALWLLLQIARILHGGRISLFAAAATAVLLPMLALALGLSAAAGFFKVVLDRFADDGGSAFTRLEMFEIFEYLSWRDILIGADPVSDRFDSPHART